jgi:hypothetical protein
MLESSFNDGASSLNTSRVVGFTQDTTKRHGEIALSNQNFLGSPKN